MSGRGRCAALLLCLSSVAVQADERVLVFTTEARPVAAGEPVETYYLDSVAALEAQFSEGMPDDPVAADAWAQARLASPAGQAWVQQVQAAAVGPAMAWQLGVKQLPAILFQRGEHYFAVYGTTQVETARQVWNTWQAQHPDVGPAAVAQGEVSP